MGSTRSSTGSTPEARSFDGVGRAVGVVLEGAGHDQLVDQDPVVIEAGWVDAGPDQDQGPTPQGSGWGAASISAARPEHSRATSKAPSTTRLDVAEGGHVQVVRQQHVLPRSEAGGELAGLATLPAR